MNPHWQQFLQQNGAHVRDGKVDYFAEPAQEIKQDQTNNLLCDLSHLDLLSISGPEAKQFLQGQLTCDLEQISESQFQLGALCNPKGRTIASFRLLQIGGEFLLQTPPQMGAIAQQALNKYIIFSKAETQLNSNQWVCLGLIGSQWETILQSIAPDLSLPQSPYAMVSYTASLAQKTPLVIARDFSQHPRYLIFSPQDKAPLLWQQLAPHCKPCGNEAWTQWDILEGYGQITPSMSEKLLPHNLNYQSIGAINFKKGCYTGQEVIARMEYRGKLKTQMFIAYTQARPDAETRDVAPPKEGTPLINTETGKTQGEVINFCRTSQGRYALLVTLPNDALDSSHYKLDHEGWDSIEIEAVPYAIT